MFTPRTRRRCRAPKAEVERLRALVAAGAAPRNQLERAEEQIADAEDAAFLRKTLYGSDLTAEQADEMIAAAARRVERRQKAFESQEKLVKAQVAAATSLEAPGGEIDLAKKEYALAESRAELTRQLAAMAQAEEDLERQPAAVSGSLAERFDGNGIFTTALFAKVENAYQKKFGKPLPVSAWAKPPSTRPWASTTAAASMSPSTPTRRRAPGFAST